MVGLNLLQGLVPDVDMESENMNLVKLLGLPTPLLDACVGGDIPTLRALREVSKEASKVVLRAHVRAYTLVFRGEGSDTRPEVGKMLQHMGLRHVTVRLFISGVRVNHTTLTEVIGWQCKAINLTRRLFECVFLFGIFNLHGRGTRVSRDSRHPSPSFPKYAGCLQMYTWPGGQHFSRRATSSQFNTCPLYEVAWNFRSGIHWISGSIWSTF